MPLRYLVNGRPGNRSASGGKATTTESTVPETERTVRLLHGDNTETVNLNLTNDEITDKDEGEEVERRVLSTDAAIDVRARK